MLVPMTGKEDHENEYVTMSAIYRQSRFLIPVFFITIALFLAVIPSGCGGGGGGSRGVVAGVSNNASSISAKIAGTVIDENGNTVSGVAVTVNGVSAAVSGSDGTFSADAGTVTASGISAKLSLKKAGYEDSFPEIRITSDSLLNGAHAVSLRMLRSPDTAAEAAVAEILHANGATETVSPTASSKGGLVVFTSSVNVTSDVSAVTFTTPAASSETPDVTFSIGGATGAKAMDVLGQTGVISGSISYGDPRSTTDLERFPGSFSTTSDTGDGNTGAGALITAGFATIKLEKADGTPITQFASGTYASIKMNVPSGVTNPETGAVVRVGDTIPIFVFNESTGQWVVEHNNDGSVKRSIVQQDSTGNMFVQFTTTHLTTFNLDWKSDLCPDNTPKVKFVDTNGNPVSGVSISVYIPGWYSYPMQTYDDEADFYRAPADVDWKFIARKGDKASEMVTVSSCKNAATNSSNFVIVLKQLESGTMAAIGIDSKSGMAPFTAKFSGECFSTSSCDTFNWDFGDGGTYEGYRYPYHTYMTPGTYNAVISAIDANGVIHHATETITVTPYSGPGGYNRIATDSDSFWVSSYIITNDGGIAITGYSYSNQTQQWSSWLAKYSSSGIEQWKKMADNSWWANDIEQTTDNGFVVAGYSSGPSITKLNSSGDIIWTKTYPQYSYISSVKETTNGGYVAIANQYTYSENSSTSSIYLLTTDPSGIETGNILLTDNKYSSVNNIIPAKDGGYTISYDISTYVSQTEYDYHLLLEHRTPTGTLLWKIEYPSFSWTYWLENSLIERTNGGYMFVYYSCENNSCSAKLDIISSDGKIAEKKKYENSFAMSITPASDGNYIITFDDSFFKIDENGTFVWGRTNEDLSNYFAINQTPDGGYLSLYFNWISNQKSDLWLFKYDTDGYGPGVTGPAAAPRMTPRMADKGTYPYDSPMMNNRIPDNAPDWLKEKLKFNPFLSMQKEM